MENVDVELGDIDIIQNTVQTLLHHVENENNHTNQRPPSIYMVPSVFRDLSPCFFTPRVVSIGPLHKNDRKLQEYERYKASFVHDLLHRVDSSPDQTLEACVQKVYDSVDRIRECYDGMMTFDDIELAKMMVMDGCFILEFIYKFSKHRQTMGNMLLQQPVLHDLFLLENQIPFFVLNDIFQCTISKLGFETSLHNFILPILNYIHLFKEDLTKGNIAIGSDTHPHHLLDLFHQAFRPAYDVPSDCFWSTIQSASELDRAGVNFKPIKNAKWSMEMEVKYRFPCLFWFWGKPTLRMPIFQVHDYTEFLLKNLMAYEQSSLCCSFITSYLIAMDMLVNNEKDIATLVRSKVLENNFGSAEEAANMMNSVCKEVSASHFYYGQQLRILDSHCNSYWPKNIAWLRRTYFSSPWNIIALIAGIILFALSVVQTIFTIKAM